MKQKEVVLVRLNRTDTPSDAAKAEGEGVFRVLNI